MGIAQTNFGDQRVEGQNLSHRPQANHVPRMDRIGATTCACLARIGDLKSGVE
jgi:hypothetical protein